MKIKINKMSGRIHPLMAGAAVSVMLVSLIGVAALTGVLPTSKADHAIAVTTPAPQTALMAPGVVQPLPNQNPQYANQNSQYAPGQAVAVAPMAAAQAPAPVHHPASRHHTAPTYAPNDSNYQSGANYNQQAADVCNSCGRVESVQAVRSAAKPSGVGIGVGAVIGGLLGNQVGGGNGRTLATVAGAVGGGYAGNEVEKRTHTTTSYQVRVRMDNGETRTFPQHGADGWRVGDRVRVVNGELTSRG